MSDTDYKGHDRRQNIGPWEQDMFDKLAALHSDVTGLNKTVEFLKDHQLETRVLQEKQFNLIHEINGITAKLTADIVDVRSVATTVDKRMTGHEESHRFFATLLLGAAGLMGGVVGFFTNLFRGSNHGG